MFPQLRKLIELVNHLRANGATNSQIADVLRELVNSPILAAAVAATPTPLDDLILAALKMWFPPVTPEA
jgi:hypothetical protein